MSNKIFIDGGTLELEHCGYKLTSTTPRQTEGAFTQRGNLIWISEPYLQDTHCHVTSAVVDTIIARVFLTIPSHPEFAVTYDVSGVVIDGAAHTCHMSLTLDYS